jgi:hypothetical protein
MKIRSNVGNYWKSARSMGRRAAVWIGLLERSCGCCRLRSLKRRKKLDIHHVYTYDTVFVEFTSKSYFRYYCSPQLRKLRYQILYPDIYLLGKGDCQQASTINFNNLGFGCAQGGMGYSGRTTGQKRSGPHHTTPHHTTPHQFEI